MRWLQRQEDLLIMKYDKKIGPAIIENDVFITRVCRDHIYQRDTYRYIPTAIEKSKLVALKMKVGYWIKRHAEQLTITKKRFITKTMKDTVDPFPWLYGMIKIHMTLWAMRPIISCTDRLIHPISVWNDSNYQRVATDIPDYFKDSKVLKEQLTTTDLPPVTMLLTSYATSMYTDIQTCPDLNQIAKYLYDNKTK